MLESVASSSSSPQQTIFRATKLWSSIQSLSVLPSIKSPGSKSTIFLDTQVNTPPYASPRIKKRTISAHNHPTPNSRKVLTFPKKSCPVLFKPVQEEENEGNDSTSRVAPTPTFTRQVCSHSVPLFKPKAQLPQPVHFTAAKPTPFKSASCSNISFNRPSIVTQFLFEQELNKTIKCKPIRKKRKSFVASSFASLPSRKNKTKSAAFTCFSPKASASGVRRKLYPSGRQSTTW